jgi:hypothetical protein
MAKQTINLGKAANDRTGDPLRLAFTKINDNFGEIYNGQFPVVSFAEQPPLYPVQGQLWYSSVDQSAYVYNGTTWSPSTTVNTFKSFGANGIFYDAISKTDSIVFVEGQGIALTMVDNTLVINNTFAEQPTFNSFGINNSTQYTAVTTIDSIQFASGTNTQLTLVDNVLTIANTMPYSFTTVNVNGSTDIIASNVLNSVVLQEGSGITLTVVDNIVTINNVMGSPTAFDTFKTFGINNSTQYTAANNSDVILFAAGTNIQLGLDNNVMTITNTQLEQVTFNTIKIDGADSYTAISPTDTIIFKSGNNIGLSLVGNVLTIDDDQVAFGKFGINAGASYNAVSIDDTMLFAADSGIALSLTDNILTISNTFNNQLTFKTISIDGTASTYNALSESDTLIFKAGNNINLSLVNNVLTIDNALNAQLTFNSFGIKNLTQYTALTTADSIQFKSGTGIGLTLVDNVLTIDNTVTASNVFNTIATSSGATYIANNTADSIVFKAGPGVAISLAANELTISNTSVANKFESFGINNGSMYGVANTSDTILFEAGYGINLSLANNVLTIKDNKPSFSVFKSINADGTYNADMLATEPADDFTIAAGNNIALAVDTSNRKLTIGIENLVRPASGSVVIDFSFDDIVTTTLSANINVTFSNYKIGAKVTLIVKPSGTYDVNLGVPPEQTTIGSTHIMPDVSSALIVEYICTTTNISGVYAYL